MELIDKDALLAEIDRQKIGYNVDGKHSVEYDITKKIIDIINTLEVKEVDLDTDFGVCWGEYCDCGGNINDYKIAKHFFELGLKAQKGE